MRIIITYLVLFFAPITVVGQQINLADNIRRNYENAKSFSVEIELHIDFSTQHEGTPIKSNGAVVKDENNYYSSIMGVTHIATKDYELVIDNGQKIILIQNRVPIDYYQQFNIPVLSSEELNQQFDFIFENDKKAVIITIIPKQKKEYSSIKVKVDAKKYYLLEVHTFYSIEDNRVKSSHLYYNKTTFNKKIDKDYFDLKKYVNIQPKKVEPSSSYKKYKLINNLGYDK